MDCFIDQVVTIWKRLFIGLNPRDCKSPSARNLGPVTTLIAKTLGISNFSFRNSFFGISYLIFIFKAVSRISQILCTADPLLCVTWLEDFKKFGMTVSQRRNAIFRRNLFSIACCLARGHNEPCLHDHLVVARLALNFVGKKFGPPKMFVAFCN